MALGVFLMPLKAIEDPIINKDGEPERTQLVRLKTFFNEVDLPMPESGGEGEGELIRYEAAFTNAEIRDRLVDRALPFGRTVGQSSVGSVGGSSYNVQLILPPGTNGMVPSLTINYNGMGGDGHMGMGWSISGFGAVTRSNKNIFYDGAIDEQEHQKTDAYLLNGSRLKHISGTYGAGGSVYGVEQEDFSVVKAVGSNYSGPAWFKVQTKEGLTYEYGNSSNSLFYHSDGTVLAWALSKIVDCNGNYVEFKYTNLGSEQLIDEILYTGNIAAGLTPYNKIKFHYASRSDENTSFVKGFWSKAKIILWRKS